MLIKVLSYGASLVSAGRHKPILISLAVVLFSITGLTLVTSFYSDSPRSGTSSAQPDAETDSQRSDTTPSLDLSSKNPKTADNDQPTSNQSQIGQTTPSDPNTAGDNASSPANPGVTIALDTPSLSLDSSTPGGSVTATMSDDNSVGWSLAAAPAGNKSPVSATIEEGKEIGATTNIRFRLEADAAPGEYRFVLQAKDASRSITLTKTILIRVTP